MEIFMYISLDLIESPAVNEDAPKKLGLPYAAIYCVGGARAARAVCYDNNVN